MPATYFTFNAACSDVDNITVYNWDFGDGDTGTGQTIGHQYGPEAGPWTVTLTVGGPGGTSVTTSVVSIGGVSGASLASVVASQTAIGTDPQVMLRISNDAAKTWVSEQWRSAGKMGEWWRRIRWNGLGSGRRRVFEVVVTDPVPWRLVGAVLEPSQMKPAATTGGS